MGTNELIGTNPANLGPALLRLMEGRWKKGAIPEKWDGRAAVRIVAELERLLSVAGVACTSSTSAAASPKLKIVA